MTSPAVTTDPRFRAGRKLVESGKSSEAIPFFATLTEESRTKYGPESIETSACYYEYGNSLFRDILRRKSGDENRDVSSSASVSEDGEKGKKRKLDETTAKKKSEASEKIEKKEDETNDDLMIALEMMENSFSIFDLYSSSTKETHSTKSDNNSEHIDYTYWCRLQIPRVLIGIGELYSSLEKHADAVDAYARAIPYREANIQNYHNIENGKKDELSCDFLKLRRLLVEAYVMVAEELMACDRNQDVVTNPIRLGSKSDSASSTTSYIGKDRETNNEKSSNKKEAEQILIVKASDLLEYVQGYYDKARDELQETVLLMGRIAAANIDLGTEKEDICFLATLLMNVGNQLADLIEEEEAGADERNKKAKKI